MSSRKRSSRLPVALGLGVALLASPVVLPSSASGADTGVTWDGSFDDGGVPAGTITGGGTGSSQYSKIQQWGGAGTSSLVTDRRRTAGSTHALKAVLPAGAAREQWISDRTWTPDATGSVESWSGFSLYLDEDWDQGKGLAAEVNGSSWFIPAEWRSTGKDGSLSLTGTSVEGEPRLELRRRGAFADGLGNDKIDAGPLVTGSWMDFVVHVRWSTAGGAVRELWRDGVLLGRKTSSNASSTAAHALWVGPAQATSITHTRTTFVDNVRMGSSYAAVDPARDRAASTTVTAPSPSSSPTAAATATPKATATATSTATASSTPTAAAAAKSAATPVATSTATATSSPAATATTAPPAAPAPTASSAPGSLSFLGDAETGNTSQWCDAHSAVGLTTVTSPVRDGRYAYRTEVRDGAQVYGTERSELANGPSLCGKDTYTVGEENFTALSVRPAADFPKYSHWSLVAQFKGPHTGTPPLQISLINDTWAVLGSGRVSPRPRWTVGALERGAWNDFVIHAKWSPDPKVGWFAVYYQGQLVVPKTSTATMYLDDGVPTPLFLSVGQYRDTAPTSGTAVLHVDAVKVGSTLAAVTPPKL